MKKILAIFFTLLLIGFVYVKTMPPSVLSGDGARFQILAHSLGIAHPPGYPFYILFSHVFSILPFANPAFRTNLFSMLGSMAFLVIMLGLFLKKNIPLLIAISTIATLALSDIFWSLSIRAEVYTFYLFILTGAVWYFMLYWQHSYSLHLYLASFLLGIYISNRLYMAPLGLVFFIYIFFKNRHSFSYKKFGYSIILFVLPFFINFMYVMLVDKYHVGYNYIDLYNQEYQILPPADSWSHVFRRARWILFAEQFQGLLKLEWNRFETGLFLYGKSLVKANFTLIGIFISILGAWRFSHKEKGMFFFLSAIFFNNLAYFLLNNAGDRITFILPSFFVICFFLAFGIYELYVQLPRIRKLIYILMFAMPFLLIMQNYKHTNRSQLWGHETGAEKIVANVPQNVSVFLSWPISTTFIYLQKVEGQRKDIRIIPCHEGNIQKYMSQHPEQHPFYVLDENKKDIIFLQ